MTGVRRNLVVVRAGRNSLHPMWLDGPGERNWDLIVSSYDPEAHFKPHDEVQSVLKRGGKWDGLYALFADSDLLSRYDYFWLPDDDIAATTQDINAIFDAMRHYKLEVAQPSLKRDSYFTHFVVMQCPGFTVRYINFVEIMVPCLTARLLGLVLEDFRDSESGFGMDAIWTRLSDDPRYKAAILDSVAVRHTRPVGKLLRSKMAERGKDPYEEQAALRARYGVVKTPKPMVYAAIDTEGRQIDSTTQLGWKMVHNYRSVFGDFRDRFLILKKLWQMIRRHTGRNPDLTPLRRISSAAESSLTAQ